MQELHVSFVPLKLTNYRIVLEEKEHTGIIPIPEISLFEFFKGFIRLELVFELVIFLFTHAS